MTFLFYFLVMKMSAIPLSVIIPPIAKACVKYIYKYR